MKFLTSTIILNVGYGSLMALMILLRPWIHDQLALINLCALFVSYLYASGISAQKYLEPIFEQQVVRERDHQT